MGAPTGGDLGTTPGRALLRSGLGLLIGFVGAFVTLQVIDRVDAEPEAAPLEVVLGRPDFDDYCARDGQQLRALATTGDADGWHCVGRVQGLWTTTPIAIDEACRWEHGRQALARLAEPDQPDGWVCVESP